MSLTLLTESEKQITKSVTLSVIACVEYIKSHTRILYRYYSILIVLTKELIYISCDFLIYIRIYSHSSLEKPSNLREKWDDSRKKCRCLHLASSIKKHN